MTATNDEPAADHIESRTFDERPHLHQLLEAAKRREPLRVAVVHPVDGPSLLGALEASEEQLIEPILVGPEARIRAAAEELEADLAP